MGAEQEVKRLIAIFPLPHREFKLEWYNQRDQLLLLPLFLGRVVPPGGIDNGSAVFHYVRSIPFGRNFQEG